MQQVTQDFIDVMQSDSPNVVYTLEIDLGDYALPEKGAGIIVSTIQSDKYAGEFVINHDRTHAHNYWMGTGIAGNNGVINEWLEINLGIVRPINKVNIWGHPHGILKDFSLHYWDGAAWPMIKSFTDNTEMAKTVTFAELSTSKIRLAITKVEAYKQAMVCAVEIYRTVDLTDRMVSAAVDRNEYQAGQLNVVLQNYDQAFSYESPGSLYYGDIHTNLNIRLTLGFEVKGNYVFLPSISGLIDDIVVNSATQLTSIKARDWIKVLIDRESNSPLYYNKSHAFKLESLANLGGISSARIDVSVSTPTSEYAHFGEIKIWEAMKQIVEAIGDADLYFTEDERLVLKRHVLPEDYGPNTTGGTQISSLVMDEDFVHVFCGVNNGHVVTFRRGSKDFVAATQVATYLDTGAYGYQNNAPVLAYDDAPGDNNVLYGGLTNNRLTRLPATKSTADIGRMAPCRLGASGIYACELGKIFLYKEFY